jgi:3-dehydroquinate synthase
MLKQSKILYGGLAALDRELAKEEWHNAKYTILVDENTFEHCLPVLIGRVEALQEAEFIEVPVGEECKSLEVAAQVWQTLLEGGADRNAVLVALGGGAVCDLGGYVAAGYKRGIRHILIPTSLLAMTDAAIGGKTAIDLGGVKNSIGHFYPAVLTVLETAFLKSLSPEEIVNGQVEMVKTAAVTDAELYQSLVADNSTFTIHNSQVKQVARLKEWVVKADPYDHSIRKILNFGHTFGHAIEVYSGLPHGLAVGVGMKVAMYLSVKKLGLTEGVYDAYSQWLVSKVIVPHYTLKDIEAMLPLMHQDKKNAAGMLRCVLLQEPGAAVIDVEVSDNEVRDALLTVTK